MATQQLAPTSPANAIHQRIAHFQGKAYLVMLALLRKPGIPAAEACRISGVNEDSFYRWKRELPGFAQAYEDICNAATDLRSEYATAAFLEATPDIADAMITRAKGERKDAQRAGERILETVGVLRSEKQTDIALSITDRAMQMWVRRQEGSQVRQVSVTVAQKPETQDAPGAKVNDERHVPGVKPRSEYVSEATPHASLPIEVLQDQYDKAFPRR